MSVKLPISFPSEAEQLRQHLEAIRGLTPHERLFAVADALAAAETLSMFGGRRTAQLEYHRRREEQCHRCIKEFIAEHVAKSNIKL